MRYLEFGRDTPRNSSDHTPGAEGLTVADYILYVTPDLYAPHSNTLSSIEFYGATIFDNLRQVLISCPRMRELTLTHILLDQYQRFSKHQPLPSHVPSNIQGQDSNITSAISSNVSMIEARNLLTIEFNSDRNITKDELIIIDFFQTQVNLPVIRSLLFNTMTYGFQPKQWANQVMDMFGQQLPASTLPNFLVKCSGTLKTFSVRRHEFIFYLNPKSKSFVASTNTRNSTNNDDDYSEIDANDNEDDCCDIDIDRDFEAMSLVQLQKIRFQCDTEGIHYLLRMQNNLEKLDCYSHHEETSLNLSNLPQLKRSIEECIEKSKASLKQIHTIGIIAFPKYQIDDFLSSITTSTSADGSVQDNCYNTRRTNSNGQINCNDDVIVNHKINPGFINNNIFTTDLKMFKDCSKLTNLWIAKMDNRSSGSNYSTGNSRAGTASSAQLNLNVIFDKHFTFINSQYLPTTLFQLEIWIGHVISEELVQLTLRFREMVNLHYFRLTSATVFHISLECFQNIISIPDSWIQAHFYNGLLADNFCPQQLLLEEHLRRPDSIRSWEVKISDTGCEFLCRESKTYF